MKENKNLIKEAADRIMYLAEGQALQAGTFRNQTFLVHIQELKELLSREGIETELNSFFDGKGSFTSCDYMEVLLCIKESKIVSEAIYIPQQDAVSISYGDLPFNDLIGYMGQNAGRLCRRQRRRIQACKHRADNPDADRRAMVAEEWCKHTREVGILLEKEIHDRMIMDLREEFAGTLIETASDSILDMIFSRAYEEYHSYGYTEVSIYLSEYAKMCLGFANSVMGHLATGHGEGKDRNKE